MDRRFFLKAVAAVSAVLPLGKLPDFRIIEPATLLLPGEDWFASVREVRGYDVYWHQTTFRWDLLGLDRHGHQTQLGVDFTVYGRAEDVAKVAEGRKIATQVLSDAMRREGIDLRSLRPLPAVREWYGMVTA